MAVSALLAELLTCKANKNYNDMQLIFINTKYDQNQTEMARWEKLQAGYEKAYDAAIGNKAAKACGGVVVNVDNQNEAVAAAYATAYVKHDMDEIEYMIDELTELDNLYSIDQAVLQTHNDELGQTIDNLNSKVAEEAKKTGEIGG